MRLTMRLIMRLIMRLLLFCSPITRNNWRLLIVAQSVKRPNNNVNKRRRFYKRLRIIILQFRSSIRICRQFIIFSRRIMSPGNNNNHQVIMSPIKISNRWFNRIRCQSFIKSLFQLQHQSLSNQPLPCHPLSMVRTVNESEQSILSNMHVVTV